MQTIKTNLLLWGGAMKHVSDIKELDLSNKTLVKESGRTFTLTQRASPLFRLRGKMFYKQIATIFFLPLGASLILFLLSMNMIFFAPLAWWVKALLAIQYISGWAYVYDAICALEKRSEPNPKMKYLLLLPFATLIITVAFFMPGFVMSAMFLSALAFFFIEEAVLHEVKFFLKKGTTFWMLQEVDSDGNCISNNKELDGFYLAAYA
jgi:hypothetical protein